MKDIKNIVDGIEQGLKFIEDNVDKMGHFRKETSRLNSIANKRIRRMLVKSEETGFTSPALEKWKNEGAEFFEIRSKKTWNDIQKERARVTNFLNSSTSSIRGTNKTLKDMAKNIGIEYDNMADLQSKSKKFFELSSKIDQYYKSKSGEHKNYITVWENINKYVQQDDIDLNTTDIDSLIEPISKMIEEQYFEEQAAYSQGLDDLLLF